MLEGKIDKNSGYGISNKIFEENTPIFWRKNPLNAWFWHTRAALLFEKMWFGSTWAGVWAARWQIDIRQAINRLRGEYFSEVKLFQRWIFFRGEYFSGVNIFQEWIFFRVDYFSGVSIFPGWIFSGVDIFQGGIFFRGDYFSEVNIFQGCSSKQGYY